MATTGSDVFVAVVVWLIWHGKREIGNCQEAPRKDDVDSVLVNKLEADRFIISVRDDLWGELDVPCSDETVKGEEVEERDGCGRFFGFFWR